MDAHSLGRYLRETREAKELTLDDAEAHLRIRRRMLEAFEQGDFNPSDVSPVQIRGFIRNYARFLGLDEDRVIQLYENALHGEPRRRKGRRSSSRTRSSQSASQASSTPRALSDTHPSQPRATLGERRERRAGSLTRMLSTLVFALVGLAALAVIIFVTVQLLDRPDNTDPTRRDILGQLPPTATFTPAVTFTPRPTFTSAAIVQQNFTGRGVAVTISVGQRTWMTVTTDGNVQIARLVLPGEVLDYRAQTEITLSASNAEALSIIYNGQQQGLMGGRGQAVDITFSGSDMRIITGPGFDPTSELPATLTPTVDFLPATLLAAQTPSITPGPSPTPTNTPSITPTPSDTPTPTDTPTITPTPSDTPTPTNTPTITPTPSITPTPTPTAILPPRATQPNQTPTKAGG